MTDDDLVMGESRALLREAFLSMRTWRDDEGHLQGEFELPARLGEPFLRALERTCEELADDDERRGVPVREGQELQTAAFVALMLRATDTQY